MLQQVFTFLKGGGTDTFTLAPIASDGPWLQHAVTETDPTSATTLHGEVAIRTTDGQYWVMYGYSVLPLADYAPVFARSVGSWRPDLLATAPPPPVDQHAAAVGRDSTLLVGLVPLVLGIVVGLPLALRGRRRPGPVAVAGLFLFVAGLVPFAFTLRDLAAAVGISSVNVPQLDYFGLQGVVALFSVVAVVWLVASGQMVRKAALFRGLLILNGSLQIVSWLGELSASHGAQAGQLTSVSVDLVVLAFLWDLIMSGKEITNRDSPTFPRSSRVLLYLGYTVLLATSALYFASETYEVSGGRVPTFSDASTFSQAGLVILGTGLLVTLFLMGRDAIGRDTPSAANS